MLRRLLVGGLVIAAGCQSTKPGPASVPSAPANESPAPPIARITEVKPVTTKPVKATAVSRKKDDDDAPVDHLMKAAEYMEADRQPEAAGHLRMHLKSHPEQIMIRAYLAELLYKSKEYAESRWQYERFITAAQEANGPAKDHMLHCHTRLMEVAEEENDGYAENLHRGIGLYLLSVQTGKTVGTADDNMSEKMLLRATESLRVAAKLKPTEARPAWYLHQCWTALNQPTPAGLALRQAKELADASDLTKHERESLRVKAWR